MHLTLWNHTWQTAQCNVLVYHQHSAFIKSSTGVSLSVLGILLFSLYIDDLPSVCSDINVQMYADGTVVYAHGKKPCIKTVCCNGTSYHMASSILPSA